MRVWWRMGVMWRDREVCREMCAGLWTVQIRIAARQRKAAACSKPRLGQGSVMGGGFGGC